MKMRFTDVDKWRKRWFRGTSPEAKLLLLYLYDNCGDAGVIEDDTFRFAFDIGLENDAIDRAMTELIGLEKLKHLDDRYLFLPSFIRFQYPKGLKENYNPHKGVWREIKKHNIQLSDCSLDQGLTNPSKDRNKLRIRIKDKDRVKSLWLKSTNKILSPRIEFESDRLRAIDRLLENHTLLQVVRIWQKASRSDFLTNRNDTNRNGWTASFDWIHKPTNWRKIKEGAYDNNERRLQHTF